MDSHSQRIEKLERQLEELRRAGDNLIDYIKQRYQLQSDDEFTCPFTRALARELKSHE